MPWPYPAAETFPAASGYDAPRLVVSTAPTVEPLTLAEARLFLKAGSTTEDSIITGLIKAARGMFEQQTGRTLLQTSYTAYWDRWPRAGTYIGAPASRSVELPRAPLLTVSGLKVQSVKYLDDTGSELTLSSADYTVEAGSDPAHFPRLWLDEDADVPALGSFPQALRVAFTAGYGTTSAAVPEEIRCAIYLLVAHLYENRLPVNIGASVNELPFSLRSLIEMHQIRTVA